MDYFTALKKQARHRQEVEAMEQYPLDEKEVLIQSQLRDLVAKQGFIGPMRFKRVFAELVAHRKVNFKHLRRRIPRELGKYARKLVLGVRTTGETQDFRDLALALADLMPIFVPNDVEDDTVRAWIASKAVERRHRKARKQQQEELLEGINHDRLSKEISVLHNNVAELREELTAVYKKVFEK